MFKNISQMFKFTFKRHKTKCFLNRKKTKLNWRTSKELRFFFQFKLDSIEIAAAERIPFD